VLACNGNADRKMFAEVGYPHLVMVEAVRQLHLRPLIARAPSGREKQPTLLVAGSIERQETMAMLSLLAAAFPRSDSLQIWLKGHPSLPMEEVLEALGIDPLKAGYEIKYGSIGNHLATSWMVLVPASTVAIEALAYGCEVIVPFFSTSLALSPLVGFEHYYHSVYTPEDLQKVVMDVAAGRYKVGAEEKKAFVGDYWCLEVPLSRWSALLTETDDERLRQYSQPENPVT
jgi:surface carbohydrate biosynthesis protein (TIGR04326 family)